jgi:hypothetical protein
MKFDRLERNIAQKCAPVDAIQRYERMLHTSYSFEEVGGPFVGMNPAQVLREIDPIQWQIGLNTYCATWAWMKVGPSYYLIEDVQSCVDDELNELDVDLSILERRGSSDQNERAIQVANFKEYIAAVQSYVPNHTSKSTKPV